MDRDILIRETLKNYDESLKKLEELIKRTEGMRGKEITDEQADTIIYEANILMFDIEKEKELFERTNRPTVVEKGVVEKGS